MSAQAFEKAQRALVYVIMSSQPMSFVVNPAAMAGETRSVLWMRIQL